VHHDLRAFEELVAADGGFAVAVGVTGGRLARARWIRLRRRASSSMSVLPDGCEVEERRQRQVLVGLGAGRASGFRG
jgi:hypothetical protein